MLRSWISQLDIYLHPQRLVFVRRRGIFRRKITHRHQVLLDPTTGSAGNYECQAALEALQQGLQRPEFNGLATRIILSGHFTKIRIAAWDDRLTTAERNALQSHQFEDIYGIDAVSHRVFIGNGAFGKSGLAFAVETDLLTGLKSVFKTASQRLASIQPFLSQLLEHSHKKIDQNAWIVAVEHDLLYIACVASNSWQSIRCKSVNAGWEAAWPRLIEQEAMQQGLALNKDNIYFLWPGQLEIFPKGIEGVKHVSPAPLMQAIVST